MAERGERLASRSNRARRSGSRGDERRQDLDGDVATEPVVVRAIHLAHAALAEFVDDDVGADREAGGK